MRDPRGTETGSERRGVGGGDCARMGERGGGEEGRGEGRNGVRERR